MTMGSRGNRVLPALIVLLLGLVATDVVRRALARGAAARAAPATVAAPARDAPEAMTATAGGSTAPRAPGGSAPAPALADSARRTAVRERIAREAAGTYLVETVQETDSMLRRWPDEKLARPIRLGVLRATVPGFREDFVANVTWAVTRWNAALLPVQLEMTPDTAGAAIVLTWVAGLDSNRTGRAEITWDNRGRIIRVAVTLATHTPAGNLLGNREMVALALHELGHALGLGHSSVQEDVLYPVTRANDLTDRDRRTARLLYSLPPGDLR